MSIQKIMTIANSIGYARNFCSVKVTDYAQAQISPEIFRVTKNESAVRTFRCQINLNVQGHTPLDYSELAAAICMAEDATWKQALDSVATTIKVDSYELDTIMSAIYAQLESDSAYVLCKIDRILIPHCKQNDITASMCFEFERRSSADSLLPLGQIGMANPIPVYSCASLKSNEIFVILSHQFTEIFGNMIFDPYKIEYGYIINTVYFNFCKSSALRLTLDNGE